MTKVSIIGASGYTGGELLRILSRHPKVEIIIATSREYKGKPVHYAHPNLRGISKLKRLKYSETNIDKIASESDVVFLAVPHGVSLKYVPKLLEVGLKIIDLSADFRLKDPEEYKRWYGIEHPYPDLLKKSVYGLPELHREEIRNTTLIGNPGCNSTAGILSLIPLVKHKVIDLDHIAIDVKVGSSEAGAKPSKGSHHPERENVMRPYSAEGHRHVAEIEQELSIIAGRKLKVAFTPHAVSSIRGALASAHTWLIKEVDEISLLRIYTLTYAKEPFVRVVYGAPLKYPDPKYVIGSNFADIGFALDKRVGRVVSFAAIDNLVKGASGQAVQCFNIMMGFEETLGLDIPPLRPA